jgi:hypothetical protein
VIESPIDSIFRSLISAAPRSVLLPLLDGLQACRWFHLWRRSLDNSSITIRCLPRFHHRDFTRVVGIYDSCFLLDRYQPKQNNKRRVVSRLAIRGSTLNIFSTLDTECDKSNLATCRYRFYLTPLEDLEALNGSGSTLTTCQNRKRRLSTSRAI